MAHLLDLIKIAQTEDSARGYVEKLLWPIEITCPKCHGTNIILHRTRAQYDCRAVGCKHRFSVRSVTGLRGTSIPLTKVLLMAYLVLMSPKGESTRAISKALDMRYDTAFQWMHHYRRSMLVDTPLDQSLTGIVEVDETHLGASVRGMGKGFKLNKSTILGIVERGGRVIFQVIDSKTRKVLHEFILANTDAGVTHIITDEFRSYTGIDERMPGHPEHQTVNHSAREFVRGQAYTNTIESVWALVGRIMHGTFHHVSTRYLPWYLIEIQWRFNHRNDSDIFANLVRAILNDYSEGPVLPPTEDGNGVLIDVMGNPSQRAVSKSITLAKTADITTPSAASGTRQRAKSRKPTTRASIALGARASAQET